MTKALYELSVAEARAADLASIQAAAGTGEPVAEVLDLTYPGPDDARPVRVYRPAAGGGRPAGAAESAAGGPAPAAGDSMPAGDRAVVVYFYGGGWTLGCVDTADAVARRLANRVPATVVVPGYRLAPEHPFPAAVEDCYAAVCWAAARFGGPVAVAGDSAGGNLAAVVAILARDRGGPELAGQALVYPNTDFGAALTPAGGRPFNATSVAWYWGHYLADPADGTDPRASPARAPEHGGLPPALVLTAEHDPLRGQGEAYAATLAAAGVHVDQRRYVGTAHGFFTMTGVLDAAVEAQDAVAAALRRWLR